ncbi:MAG: DUF3127 domain-containing protein [Akkermansiaceae bacterium]|nr:DUF3127 domain-containing protein [Akkermansiaceae bacterium]MCF7733561.1 DUF3127 domain-containing protein [Akkermansiaceae bacterium]
MSQSFELEGTLKLIYDTQTFASGFAKREFVVETKDDRYPQSIKFECVKEKTAMLDTFELGDTLLVSFDIRGNEFKDKYYVNLNAWKIAKVGEGSAAAPPASDGPPSSDDSKFDNEPDPTDDIPF